VAQKKKPGRKPKKKLYFDLDVQDAIVRYNALDRDKDQAERNKIYQEEIHKAFDKLCENIINTFKFEYFDDVFIDVKNTVVSFLVMNIHKYDHTKGSKAFSYFSIVAKNYLILHNNSNYKRYKTHDSIDVLEYKTSSNFYSDGKSYEFFNDFTDQLIKYFDNKIPTIFNKKKNIDIAYAILEILKKRDDIEEFNKKSIYILIREMTNVKTSDITKVVNVFRSYYQKLLNEFDTTGHIELKNNKFF